MSDDVFMFAVRRVKFDPENENQHPPEQVEALQLSLEIFGQQKAILLDKNNICIAGEGVLRAARALKWKQIECERSLLEGADRDGYRLVDNTSGRWGQLDFEIMRANLDGLRPLLGARFNFLALGFTPAELKAINEIESHAPIKGPGQAEKKAAGLVTIKVAGIKANHRRKVLTIVNRVIKGTDYSAEIY